MGVFDAIPVGAPTFTTGVFNQGVNLANNTVTPFNYLQLPLGGPWNYNPLDSWTLEFRVNVTGTSPTATVQTLFSIGTASSAVFYINLNTNGSLQVNVATNPVDAATVSSAGAMSTGSSHHLRYIQVTGTSYYLFVDGTQVLTHTIPNGKVPFTGNLPSIFAMVGGFVQASASTNGSYDEIAVFNRDIMNGTYSTFTPPSSAYLGTETGLVALYHLDNNYVNSGSGVVRVTPNSVPINAGNGTIDTIPVTNAQTIVATNYGNQNWTSSSVFSVTAGTLHPPVVNTSVSPQTATFLYETPSATTAVTFTGPNNLTATITPTNTPYIGAVSASLIPLSGSGQTFSFYGVNTSWPTSPPGTWPVFSGQVGGSYTVSAVTTATGTGAYAAVSIQKVTGTLLTGTRAGAVTVGEQTDSATYPITLAIAQVSLIPSAGNVLAGSAGFPITATVALTGGNNNCSWACTSGGFLVNLVQVPTVASAASVTWVPPATPNANAQVFATSVVSSTTATAIFNVGGVVASGTVALAIATGGGVDSLTVPAAPQQGTYPVGAIGFYVGTAPGTEAATPFQTVSAATFPLTVTHGTAPAGSRLYYVARALDNQTPANASVASNEVCSGTSTLTATGLPETYTVSYEPLGGPFTGTSGLVGTLGITVLDNQGLTLLSRTTAGIAEQLNTGAYTATLTLYSGWSGTFLWDSLPGYVSSAAGFDLNRDPDLTQELLTADGVETTTGGQYGNGTLTFTKHGTGTVIAAWDLKRDPVNPQNVIQRTRTV